MAKIENLGIDPDGEASGLEHLGVNPYEATPGPEQIFCLVEEETGESVFTREPGGVRRLIGRHIGDVTDLEDDDATSLEEGTELEMPRGVAFTRAVFRSREGGIKMPEGFTGGPIGPLGLKATRNPQLDVDDGFPTYITR